MEHSREYAIQLVKRWDTSVVALYTAFEEAAPFVAAQAEYTKPKMFIGNEVVKNFETDLNERLDKEIEVTKVVEDGPYEVTIPTVAANEQVDLVVLGSIHTGVERRIVGSDAERVIEYSPCSVLLVRSPSPIPEDGPTVVFAHDSPRIAPRAVPDLVALCKKTGCSIQPVIGMPTKGMEAGVEMAEKLVASLSKDDVETREPQVLTSRWILGPHAVVHRAVSGIRPPMAVLARYPEAPWGNATHWLVHEFVADTPCPMLFMK
jgi:nucleotide-binding universal stress UspA family protein